MGWIFAGIAIILILLGAVAFGGAVVAGCDPEGRGGDIMQVGLKCAAACCFGLVADIAFVIYHYWLS